MLFRIFVILLCYMATVSVFAQKDISASEYERIDNTARLFLTENPYTSREMGEWRDAKTSEITSRIETVRKVVPPSKSYLRRTRTEGGKTTVFEEIVIGDVRYRSSGDSDGWTASQAVKLSTGFSMRPDATGITCRFIGEEEMNGVVSRVFMTERSMPYRIKGERKDRIEKYVRRIWIGSAGEYLKVVTTLKDGPGDENETVIDYGYKGDFKIEAPIK